MSTVLRIEFPWGRYHATPWNRSANEGVAEWPPSPWRILRALFSSWKVNHPELAESEVMPVLGKLGRPPVFYLPSHAEAHSRHYLPGTKHMEGVASSTDKTLDAFIVVDRGAALWVEWQADLAPFEWAILQQLAEGVSYLGRAESITACTLDDAPGEGARCCPLAPDDPSSGVRVLVPDGPITAALLAQSPSSVRSARRLLPQATHLVAYSQPAQAPVAYVPRASVATHVVDAVRLAIGGNVLPSRFDAASLGSVLHAASVRRHREHSLVLSGKDAAGQRAGGAHVHAHYLSLPERFYLDGRRVASFVIWAPAGFSEQELDALAGLRQLRSNLLDGTVREVTVMAEGPVAEVAPEIVATAGAHEWVSVTPYSPVHHHRGDLLDQLRADLNLELGHRRLPAVADVDLVKGPWLHYGRYRVGRERIAQQRRAYGLRLRFAEPVAGPLALGQLSHFGLGLFRPVRPAHE